MFAKKARFIYDSDTALAVTAGTPITFSNIVSNSSCIQGNGSGGIQLKSPGTYRIISSFTLNATAAGNVNIQMSANGNPVNGARSAATLAAAGDLSNVVITDLITVKSGTQGSFATLTFAPSAAVGIRTATVIIEKVL